MMQLYNCANINLDIFHKSCWIKVIPFFIDCFHVTAALLMKFWVNKECAESFNVTLRESVIFTPLC